jgi:hypothetical protein
VWALVETAFWFPSSGGRRSSVHGCGSVHAVVELRKDVRELHHLTGHYRMFAQEPPPDFDISCRREPRELPELVAEMVSYMRLLKESVLRIWKARKAAVREELDRAERAAKAIQKKLDHLAFLFERSIDIETYDRHAEKLREELTLARIDRQ